MGRIIAGAPASGLGKGSTRFIDIVHDIYDGRQGGAIIDNAAPSNKGRARGGSQIVQDLFTHSSSVLSVHRGKMCIRVPSGNSYGSTFDGIGFPVLTSRPKRAGALAERRYITRINASLAQDGVPDDAGTINNDVGFLVHVGDGRFLLNDWTNVAAAAPGTFGFGVMHLGQYINTHGGGPFGMYWVIKRNGIAAFDDVTFLDWGTNDLEDWCDIEYLAHDATYTDEAKLEVKINGTVALTRYWVNPPGIATPVLPAFGYQQGGQLYSSIRNTSTGPASFFCADWGAVVGPNDAGTL